MSKFRLGAWFFIFFVLADFAGQCTGRLSAADIAYPERFLHAEWGLSVVAIAGCVAVFVHVINWWKE
jgi:hypothetical protein